MGRPSRTAQAADFGRRLTELYVSKGRQRRGLGAELSKRYKVAPVSANAWLNGTSIPAMPILEGMARELNVTVQLLLTGRDGAPSAANSDDYADVIGYAQAAGLSDGEEMAEYQDTHSLKFKRTSLARKHLNAANLAVMYGKGDSMLPRIQDGDAILFDTSDTRPKDDCLFVILVPGVNGSAYSVKRCIELSGTWWFDALNPQGDHHWKRPRPMDNDRHPIHIIGRVRWIGSWED